MLKYIFLSLFFIQALGSITAQSFFGKINPSEVSSQKITQDSLRILAVMVEFQEDKDPATYGNGKFGTIYTKSYGSNILDPLPHDKSYFSLHMDFASNYFRKVSSGKLNLSCEILPGIVTVSKRIRDYSPGINSTDYTLLANLVKEVWSLVSAQNPGIKFSDYDLFTIFHAGVGRDISLPGSLGTDKDLPSLYLSDKALRDIFKGDLSGLPANRQASFNSMIIPETESREMSDITGSVNLIQITINGLIAANIGSHLGLPDLYDTKTGLSAIGRFGLMDGQSIFAYNGNFPPEPSPWEKMFLGWIQPVEINTNSLAGAVRLALSASRSASAGDTTVIKVPLSSTEYYLVENRSRDALKNGSSVTYSLGGQKVVVSFPKDTTGYRSFDTDSLKGVVTDVDEFDWALPGSGIVIWHIDENVINSSISTNQINVDKFKRGVDVEEADGVQDIGEKFTDVFGNDIIGEGTPQDFWYSSNDAKLYKNRFAYNSTPPARTNTGAASPFSFSNFTDISNKMSFSLARDFSVTPELTQKLPSGAQYLTASGQNNYYVISKDSLYNYSGTLALQYTQKNFSSQRPAVLSLNNFYYVFGAYQNSFNVIKSSDPNQAQMILTNNLSSKITSAPVITMNSSNNYDILLGTENGSVITYTLTPNSIPNLTQTGRLTADSTYSVTQIASDGSAFIASAIKSAAGASIIFGNQGNQVSLNDIVTKLALTKDRSGKYVTVALTRSGGFYLISDGAVTANFKPSDAANINSFSLGDLRQNGENYIVYQSGNILNALNLKGAAAENFPVEDPESIGFTGTPLIVGGQRSTESVFIYAFTKDGRIFEIDAKTGKVTPDFPVSVGSEAGDTPVLSAKGDKVYLSLVTNNNYFYSWNTNLLFKKAYWMQSGGNEFNSAFAEPASLVNSISGFLPKERAYNWPNPVYGNETNIRYYVSEDSKINIKIFDLAGGFVAELNSNALGGADNETVWNVSNVQSGVYLARIEAEGVSGKKENNIIKIAVVK